MVLTVGPCLLQDLALLGRNLSDVIIVDNSPHSYVFQPANAVPIGKHMEV